MSEKFQQSVLLCNIVSYIAAHLISMLGAFRDGEIHVLTSIAQRDRHQQGETPDQRPPVEKSEP